MPIERRLPYQPNGISHPPTWPPRILARAQLPLGRTGTNSASGTVSDDRAALILEVNHIVRVARRVIEQACFCEAGIRSEPISYRRLSPKRQSRVSQELIVGHASQQVVGGGQAIAGYVAGITSAVTGVTLTEAGQRRVRRRGGDRNRTAGVIDDRPADTPVGG